MHIPRIEVRSLDETVEAVDLGQTPADVVFLSFSDSDLNALARAYDSRRSPKPTLRLASLAALRHPFSIDLYLEKVCAHARIVVARVLGGADYWRYGVDELAALARRRGFKLALLPGDRRPIRGSTRPRPSRRAAVDQIWRYFDEGGPENMAACLRLSRKRTRRRKRRSPRPFRSAPSAGSTAACFEAAPGAPHALIVFYRSIYLADDLRPIEALALALERQGLRDDGNLCDEPQGRGGARAPARAASSANPSMSCSTPPPFPPGSTKARRRRSTPSTRPVLQVVLAGIGLDAWRASPRGPRPGRPRDACRAAGDRRPHPHPRHFLQGRARARRR